MTFRFARLAAPVFAAAMIAAPAVAEELSLAHWVAPGHVLNPSVIEPMQKSLADQGGALTIKVYPGGELGPGPVEQYARAVTGVADITWGLAGYNSQQFQLSSIVELPGVVDKAGAGYTAVWRAYADHLTGEFPGTVPLALWTSEPNVLILKDKVVRTPADMAGLRIRVSGAVPGAVIEALGATPVQMPANEMYNALQTGLIDGIMTGGSAILDFKINEVASSYTTGASLGNILFFLVMNKARYDGLAPELRAQLDKATGEMLSASGEAGWNAKAAQALTMLKADATKTVVELSPEEAAAFNALTVPVTEAIVGQLEAAGKPARAVLAAMTGM